MSLRIKGTWILAGLLGFGATFGGRHDVEAGAISIKGTTGPVKGTDPYYFYDFQVTLAAGYQWENGDFITINSVPGITPINFSNPNLPIPGSTSSQPLPFTSPIITVTDSTPPYKSDVEWENTTTTTIFGGTSGNYLGDFVVVTSVPLSSPTVSVTFDSHMHDANGNVVTQTGIIIYLNAVPEPSSMILLISGATVLPLIMLLARRRERQKQRSSQTA